MDIMDLKWLGKLTDNTIFINQGKVVGIVMVAVTQDWFIATIVKDDQYYHKYCGKDGWVLTSLGCLDAGEQALFQLKEVTLEILTRKYPSYKTLDLPNL